MLVLIVEVVRAVGQFDIYAVRTWLRFSIALP